MRNVLDAIQVVRRTDGDPVVAAIVAAARTHLHRVEGREDEGPLGGRRIGCPGLERPLDEVAEPANGYLLSAGCPTGLVVGMNDRQQHERSGEREPAVAVGDGERGEPGQATVEGNQGASLAEGTAEALAYVVGK